MAKTLPYFPGKVRSPLKIHGGKQYLVRRHFQMAPQQYNVLIDCYMGGGTITLNAPSRDNLSRIANELDWMKVNVVRVLQDKELFPALLARLQELTYERQTFDEALKRHTENERLLKAGKFKKQNKDAQLEAAIDFITTNRMSRGGFGKKFGWSDRLRGGQPGDLNAWMTMVAGLAQCHRNYQNVQIINGYAIDAIEFYLALANVGHLQFFLYIDPPYVHESRTAKKAYGEFEMPTTKADAVKRGIDPRHSHEYLLEVLVKAPSNFHIMLCGYDSTLYQTMLGKWEKIGIEISNHSGQGTTKKRRMECVWLNFRPSMLPSDRKSSKKPSEAVTQGS